jgi:hypothetical protein
VTCAGTANLDPGVTPLSAELQSQGWLALHVMTTTASCAAFALALGVANVTLGFYLAGAADHPRLGSLTSCTHRVVQLGVLLLVVGTTSGSLWADRVWGRSWGWDPKEVWSLIALLAYVALLYARSREWIGEVGMAFLSAACFALVVMAWYGVNHLLRAGLHHYGFGFGGGYLVGGGLALQAVWMAAAGVRCLADEHIRRESARLGTAPPDVPSVWTITAA